MSRRPSLMLRTIAAVAFIAGLPAAAHAQAQKGRPEVAFNPSSGRVTVRVSPHELQGVTVPFPLRHRLAVLDNGQQRTDAEAIVEHSPFTLAVLIENGSRSHQLNWLVTGEMERFLRPLLPMLDARDRFAVFTYDDVV